MTDASPSISEYARQGLVVLALRIGLERVDSERGVLERMRVLVGVVHLRLGIELALDHDHHPAGVIVVEAEDLLAEQLELELGSVLVGPEQAECLERERVLVALFLWIVLVEDAFAAPRPAGLG